MEKGLPISEAETKAAALEKEIEAKLSTGSRKMNR